MNREELLKKAQDENKGFDEREHSLAQQASAVGFAVGGMLCMIISVVSHIIPGIDPLVNTSCWLIWCGMQTADSIFKAVRISKKGFLWSTIGFSICFFGFLAIFVIRLINR